MIKRSLIQIDDALHFDFYLMQINWQVIANTDATFIINKNFKVRADELRVEVCC